MITTCVGYGNVFARYLPLHEVPGEFGCPGLQRVSVS